MKFSGTSVIAIAIACAIPVRASTIVFSNIQPGDAFFLGGVGIGLTPSGLNYAGVGFEAAQD
ncbi:MAG TPA: hypothetical protein VMT86_13485 [Bryobacteraceae bacterium]|nr:hypothetical protein [Bryobacteraceae bacterium]